MASIVSRYAEIRSREWERANYALFGVALLCMAVFGLTVASLYLLSMLREKRVAFVFSDEIGQLHPVEYQSVRFRPDDPRFALPIKGTLWKFCKDYYERRRVRIADDLPESMAFMNVPKAQMVKDAIRNGLIDNFLDNPSVTEVKLELRNVTLGRLAGCGHKDQPICTGSAVSFYEVSEDKRKFCTVELDFGFGEPDEDLINSLGLAVTDWHKDCGAPAQN
jgi:hypothetical protein